MANGASLARAHEMALAIIARSVERQAELMAYLHDFLLLSLVFFALIPAVALVKVARSAGRSR